MKEHGKEIMCSCPRHTAEDEGGEVAEGSRDSRMEA